MNQSEHSFADLRGDESLSRRAFVSGVTIAAVSSAMTLLLRNILPVANNDELKISEIMRDTNKLWLSNQDRMFKDRQKPLAAGDEGLVIHEREEEIKFTYDFHLHPLRELPLDGHVERFRKFVESWIAERGMQHQWIACPVDVQQGVEPDEHCIIPQSMYWYHLKCTAMPKPIRHSDGMIA